MLMICSWKKNLNIISEKREEKIITLKNFDESQLSEFNLNDSKMTNSTIKNILKLFSGAEGSSVKERMTNFSSAFGILTLLPELVSLQIFAGAILIMYHAVEIEHPVYSGLFNNLTFPFFC